MLGFVCIYIYIYIYTGNLAVRFAKEISRKD